MIEWSMTKVGGPASGLGQRPYRRVSAISKQRRQVCVKKPAFRYLPRRDWLIIACPHKVIDPFARNRASGGRVVYTGTLLIA